MAAVFRLLFLVPLAYVAAVVAWGLTIAVGAVGAPDDAPLAFVAAFTAHTLYAGAMAFVPAAVAIAVVEIFAFRSVFYYLAVGGVLGFLAQQIAFYIGRVGVYETRQLLYVAGGFVAAAVYWLIAGMHAGLGLTAVEPRR
jgi:hypothetical protein